MAGSIKGIIVEIGGDTSGLQKALSKVNSATSSLSKELKGINTLLKLDPKNTELLSQKQTVLNEKISVTEEKLKALTKTKEEADKKMAEGTEVSAENYRNLQREIINTQNKLSNFKNEASNWNKTGTFLTGLGTELNTIGDKIDNLGNKLTTRVSLPIIAGFAVMTKSAIDNETAMQQVERIYGEASGTIKNFAENQAINYNMSTSEAYKYSQIYGNLIQSITDDQNENAENTQKLLQASSVIASATGRTMEDVMDRIRSGLLGNTEAIEDLGVNVNVSLLESTDAFKKFAGDKSWNQLDFQTQQQIRLMGILEQTSKKYGDEVNNNTASSIQQLTAKTKNLTTNLGNKLLPTASKLIDKANQLVDGFGNLSDTEQENIIKTGLMVASAGPLLKIGGTAISTIGNVSKGIGTFTKAIGLAKNGIGDATGASANLAKVMQNLASPVGLAATAIAAIGTVAVIAYDKATEETRNYLKETQAAAEEILKEKESIDELNTSIDNNLQSTLAETEGTKDLWSELQNITDENGKIKDGYETRASVITTQLAKALGIEISITDDVIDKYKELQDEIDNLILKKQAEAILSSSEEKYNNAILNRTQKTQELLDAQEKLNTTTQNVKDSYDKYLEEKEKADNSFVGKRYAGDYVSDAELTAQTNYNNNLKSLKEAQSLYDSLNEIVNDYTSDIENYQYNLQLYTEGTTESLNKMVDETGKTYEKNGQTVKTSFEQQILEQQLYNQRAKTLYDEAKADNNETEMQKNQTTINASNTRLQAIADELISQTSTIGENSEDVKNAWKSLATNSFDVYSQKVSELSPTMQQKIQEMTGVVVNETPTFLSVMQTLAQEGVDTLDKDSDFKNKALQSLNGYLDGLTEEEQRALLKQAGIDNVNEVIKGIKEGDVSEEQGINILKGLNTGLENTFWTSKTTGTASSLATRLSKIFSINSTTASSLPGHKSGLDYVPYDDYVARLHKGERVLTAEENKKLTEFGKIAEIRNFSSKINSAVKETSTKSMVFTTPNITFNVQTLDEANLNTAFNYINRRLGSNY